MKRSRVVLRAQRARPTRRGRWFGIAAGAFFFVWLIGADALLSAAGLPGSLRPGWLRGIVIAVALAPVVVSYVALIRPRIGHALGLTQALPSRAVLDSPGIQLSVDGRAPEVHRWHDIAALERDDRDWRLTGPDGSTPAAVPLELARPRPSWFDAHTLAEAIVEKRPDRYALRGGRFEPGLTEFALRAAGDPVGRPRRLIRLRALGVVLFMAANIVLYWLSDRP